MRIALAVLACNAALDPLLIFGLGPVPGLGIAGSAVATVFAKGAGAVVSWRALSRRGWIAAARPPDEEIRLAPTTPLAPGPLPGLDLSVARRFARVGAPTAAAGLLFVGVYLVLSNVVTSAGGDAAQAGLGAGLKGEQVAYVVGIGFAAAASSLVARRLGAGRPEDAAAAAWTAVRLASLGTGAWAALLFLGRHALARLFLGGDDVAVAHAVDYFAIVALCFVPQCWEVVLEGAFGGAGMTVPPMTVSVLLTAARWPLSWWFAIERGGGVPAIWVVIASTAAARGVFLALWFARGTWKTRTV
jgi:Na+-driven multidrug efflux pump